MSVYEELKYFHFPFIITYFSASNQSISFLKNSLNLKSVKEYLSSPFHTEKGLKISSFSRNITNQTIPKNLKTKFYQYNNFNEIFSTSIVNEDSLSLKNKSSCLSTPNHFGIKNIGKKTFLINESKIDAEKKKNLNIKKKFIFDG